MGVPCPAFTPGVHRDAMDEHTHPGPPSASMMRRMLNASDTESTFEPLLLTVPEAAAIIRHSRSVLYKLMDSGEIRSVKVGRRRLILTEALHAYVDRLEHGSAPSAA